MLDFQATSQPPGLADDAPTLGSRANRRQQKPNKSLRIGRVSGSTLVEWNRCVQNATTRNDCQYLADRVPRSIAGRSCSGSRSLSVELGIANKVAGSSTTGSPSARREQNHDEQRGTENPGDGDERARTGVGGCGTRTNRVSRPNTARTPVCHAKFTHHDDDDACTTTTPQRRRPAHTAPFSKILCRRVLYATTLEGSRLYRRPIHRKRRRIPFEHLLCRSVAYTTTS